MKFVNLNKKIDRNIREVNRKRSNRKKMLFKIILGLVILSLLTYFPASSAYQSAKKIVDSGRLLAQSVKQDDFDGIKKHTSDIKDANDGLNNSLNFLFWMRAIPYFGGFYADAKHFSQAAVYELEAAEIIVESLEPHKTELGFDGNPTPGQDKVAQMTKVLEKVIPNLDKIEPQLTKAGKEVESIDVNKYPEKIGQYRLRSQVDAAKNLIGGAAYAVREARPALEIAPSALGQPTAKNYLIVFQNDKELRATGGFMTAYATLRLDQGRVSSSMSDDIYRLDEKLLEVCKSRICPLTPPAPIAQYLPEANGKARTAWSMRDSNFSPDVPTSLDKFEQFYALLGQGLPFDGIILIDTYVVEELIKITGPVEVLGTTYSDEYDSRCECSNVIYELENYAQVIEKGEADRKAILGTLMQQILARSLGASTDKLPEFINAGVKLASSKSIMFYMHDSKTQEALSQLNWTGEIQDFDGDYLHINDSNLAGGKSNLYVTENVELDINIASDGTVKNKVTIKYDNPKPYKTWLNAINRDYLRIYTPKGSTLISSKGSEAKVNTFDDLNKTVFDGFFQVRPQNSITVTYEYQLVEKHEGKEYPILIQKQPGTKNHKYTIKVNGRQKAQFNLDSDKELRLSI